VPEFDDRAHDGPMGQIALNVVDEAPVDREFGDGQVGQHGE